MVHGADNLKNPHIKRAPRTAKELTPWFFPTVAILEPEAALKRSP